MTKARQPGMLRRTALAGAAVAALGLAAGCGGSSGDQHGKGASGAASATAGAKSSGFAPGSAVDQASVKKMFSDAVAAATTVHVEMTMDGQIQMTGSGDMDMKSKPVEADLKLASSTLGSDSIRMLMVDNAMYLQMAALGDKYVKVSLTDKNSPLAQMGLNSLDPTAMFDKFSDAITGGTYVGKETVDGTPTDHYRLDVDTTAIASALPSAMASLGAQASALPATEKIDVWFDGDGRYKQMKMQTGGENVSETFSDWGKTVTVKAPPASQVQDMTSLVNGLAGGAGGAAGGASTGAGGQ